jgi:hypothetical protein
VISSLLTLGVCQRVSRTSASSLLRSEPPWGAPAIDSKLESVPRTDAGEAAGTAIDSIMIHSAEESNSAIQAAHRRIVTRSLMDLSGRQGDFLACVDEEPQLLVHDIVDRHDGMITRQCRAKWDFGSRGDQATRVCRRFDEVDALWNLTPRRFSETDCSVEARP